MSGDVCSVHFRSVNLQPTVDLQALCHYLHLDWAVLAASFSSLLAFFTLVFRAGGFQVAGEGPLSEALVSWHLANLPS